MRRIELFKKTGICITAIMLSGLLAASGPSIVSAANAADPDIVADPTLGATFAEVAEEIPPGAAGTESDDDTDSEDDNGTDPNPGGSAGSQEDGEDGQDGEDGEDSKDGEDGSLSDDTSDPDSTQDNASEDDSDSESDSSKDNNSGDDSGDEDDSAEDSKSGDDSDSKEDSSGNSGSGDDSASEDDSAGDGNSGDNSDSKDDSSGNSKSGDDSDSKEDSSGDSNSGDASDSKDDSKDNSKDDSAGNSGSGNDSASEDDSAGDSNTAEHSESGKDSSKDSSSETGKTGSDDSSDDGKTDTGSNPGTGKTGTDSASDADTSDADEKNDSGDGASDEEGTRQPILPDSSNIPFAGGVSEPTLDVPSTDPFGQISPSVLGTDTSLPQIPSAPASYDPDASGNTSWAAATLLDGLGTVLNPNEYPAGYSLASTYTGTNEQLIASQNIVSGLSLLNDGFRFYTVEKELAVSPTTQSVYEEMNDTSRPVGQLTDNDALYVLSEENNGWLYVESGNVRGFIPSAQVVRGTEADSLLADLQAAAQDNGEPAVDGTGPVNSLSFADEIIPARDNSAYTYRRCTTKSTVVDKQYAVANGNIAILEETSEASRAVGSLASGGLCYVLLQADDHWAYVESGNVRGFTPISGLTTGNAAKKIVQRNGEATMTKAQQLVLPSDNAALYYTLNSTQEGSILSNTRTDIVQTAAECIGSPYKWGGNSLKGGCDCSGFVKQLYALYGYNLPRVAEDQARFGIQIPISDAAPGDLIFFASNGYIYHVALYAGNGMTIEAFSEDRGIIATSIGGRDAVWATRIIQD